MNNSKKIQELNAELNIVYRYLRKLGVSHQDAEDIVQESAYRFLLYYDSIDISKTRSWLIRVALNFHHDQYKKLKREELDLNQEQIALLSKDLPEEIILQKEQRSEVQKVLLKLKPHYRELILLKYQWDLKYEEMSNLLDMSIRMVKTNLFRARKQFVKYYRRSSNE